MEGDSGHHLQSCGYAPCGLPGDVRCAVLDPESDEDPEVDEALLDRDNAAADFKRRDFALVERDHHSETAVA